MTEEDFYDASRQFDNSVVFGNIDCSEHSTLCEALNVQEWPTVKLFKVGDTTGIEYKGDKSSDGYCDFIEQFTDVKSKRIRSTLPDLNSLNFKNHIAQYDCTYIGFHNVWDGSAKKVVPLMKELALIFEPESNISIAAINCEKYIDICDGNEITKRPSFWLIKNGTWMEYTDASFERFMIRFINKECGAERDMTGLLDEHAGTIEEANAVAKEFMNSDDKESSLAKMKQIAGADFYVRVMERIMKKGVDETINDVARMKKMLDERKSGIAALDGLKKRYNVFGQFVPTPSPTPAPDDDDDDENDEM